MVIEIIKTFFIFLSFLVVSIFVFTFPGFGFISFFKIKLQDWIEKYTLSTVIGIVLFTLFSYLLALVRVRFILWIFPLSGIYLFFKDFKKFFSSKKIRMEKRQIIFFAVILFFGIIVQVAVNAPSGFNFGGKLFFWGAHGRDGMWHIALMEEFKRNIYPFLNPEYAGHILSNYHFFVDLLMSDISRMFHFSNLDIYFRFFPFLFSLLLGFSGFIFVRSWVKSTSAALWAMFLTYFAGSFGFIVTLLKNGIIGGETIFWVNQTPSVLGNPPQAVAFVILNSFLFLLLEYIRSGKVSYLVLSGILAGVIIEFKVYAGLIILGSLLILGIYELFLEKNYCFLILFFVSLIISLLIYFPNSKGTISFVIFEPWWFIRTMVVDKLGLIDWELRRQTYLSVGRFTSYLRVLQLEGTAFLIFLIGNLGVRTFGFVKVVKDVVTGDVKKPMNIFLYTASFIAFVFPLLFLQRGVVYNTIQFSQYFLLFFGFFAAVSLDLILKKLKIYSLKLALSLTVIIFALPTTLGLLWQFYSRSPLAVIDSAELCALNFLKTTDSNAVILTEPFDKYAGSGKELPLPIYEWSDTGYVPAISGRRTLISDTEQIDIMGYNEARSLISAREEAFKDSSGKLLLSFLRENKIDYLYLHKNRSAKINYSGLNLVKVFTNDEVEIFKTL